jgi:hypothetical protein
MRHSGSIAPVHVSSEIVRPAGGCGTTITGENGGSYVVGERVCVALDVGGVGRHVRNRQQRQQLVQDRHLVLRSPPRAPYRFDRPA